MKKGVLFVFISILIFTLGVFILGKGFNNIQNNEKITVVATLFPQYDFVKKIGGDKVEVSLLLTPGTESHTYEPTPQDIIRINKSNLFIYTGKYMEPWSDRIISSIDSDTKVLDSSKGIELIKSEHDDDEEDDDEVSNVEHRNNDDIQDTEHQDYEQREDQEQHEENGEHRDEHNGHHHEYDPHIWLNPQNAIIMIRNIEKDLSEISPENTEYFHKNAEAYIKDIADLDKEIENTINEANKKKIAFGGTFAYSYFVNRYKLEYVSAYHTCGEDTEPSVADVKKVIDYMKQNDIKVVFYQELSSGKIADSIAKETNAKKLIFHTVHNASQDELNNGESYVSLMRKNLDNLKEALK